MLSIRQTGLAWINRKEDSLVGRVFNNLTVVDFIGTGKEGHLLWRCLCSCGNFTETAGAFLKSGHTKSCGCARQGHFSDITGERFGRLVVVNFSHVRNEKSYWNCLCDCGNAVTVARTYLTSGHVQSCGCYFKDRSLISPPEYTVEEAVNRLYGRYKAMKRRCMDPQDSNYKNYGGRGIKVCNRWLGKDGFKMFLVDVGIPPFAGCHLDRIDNNGNYEPGNFRWVTCRENSRNKRNNHFITFDGITQCLTDWENFLGINRGTIGARLGRGWSEEKALTRAAGEGRRL